MAVLFLRDGLLATARRLQSRTISKASESCWIIWRAVLSGAASPSVPHFPSWRIGPSSSWSMVRTTFHPWLPVRSAGVSSLLRTLFGVIPLWQSSIC